MTPIEDLNSRFTYEKDRRGEWHVLTGDGKISGDCEDYSLTLTWLESDKSWRKFFKNILTGRYEIWRCKYEGDWHAVVKGPDGKWADNIQRRWVDEFPEPPYDMKYRRYRLTILLKLFYGHVFNI